MSEKGDEEFSCLVSSTLDMLGYQLESVRLRSEFYDHYSNMMTRHVHRSGHSGSYACVGSIGEGVAVGDSDYDVMMIYGDTICVEKASYQSQFNILEADITACPPGYTKLVSVYCNQDSPNTICFKSSFKYTNQTGCPYISSAVFRNCVRTLLNMGYAPPLYLNVGDPATNNGPATTKITPLWENDLVPSIYFYDCKHLIHWANRARFSTWPSAELVNEISQMEGYVVPVGNKCSDNQCLEWRICYTSAEKKLVSSLNDVQMKLYVLLKLIGKKILKPVCKDISSYIVKNIVFWVVETESAKSFSPCLLMKLVRKSLFFMKHFLENNHFPNYMIPDRNLLTGVSGQYKIRVIQFLSECLKDVRATVLRIPKLGEYMYGNCSSLEKTAFSEWRNEAEKLFLKLNAHILEHVHLDMVNKHTSIIDLIREFMMRDESYFKKLFELVNLLVPECIHLLLEGRIEELMKILYLRMKALTPL